MIITHFLYVLCVHLIHEKRIEASLIEAITYPVLRY